MLLRRTIVIDLICGDCLIEMKNIADKSIDMILCDLPLDILIVI
jgi:DNA modification methylase